MKKEKALVFGTGAWCSGGAGTWYYPSAYSITENIFLVDVETRCIVESNPAFQETLGYSEEQLRGMTLYDIVAADRKTVDANIRRVLELKNAYVA